MIPYMPGRIEKLSSILGERRRKIDDIVVKKVLKALKQMKSRKSAALDGCTTVS